MSSFKTVYPGMDNQNLEDAPAKMSQGTMITGMEVDVYADSSQKPLVGFLYSISKTLAGEYWPLRLGLNTIGRLTDNNICLKERTVSSHHADLVIRNLKNPQRTICSIQDTKSTCGTMVNDKSLEFEPVECHNGDVITIGENYQLLLILPDSQSLGLKVNPNFQKAEEEYGYADFMESTERNSHEYTPAYKGTVGDDDVYPYENKRRRTEFMPKQ